MATASAKDLAQAKTKARARAQANRLQVYVGPVAKIGHRTAQSTTLIGAHDEEEVGEHIREIW